MVYDRGYRPYDGPRGGRQAAVGALWRASIRRALGLRRSWRQKVFPWTLLVIATVPAVVNVGVAYLTRDTPVDRISVITYRDYVGVSTALLVFVAVVGPDVLCPDRRQRVLPLIFARPLTGADYVWAKFSAIFTIVFAFSFLPQVVLFVGQMLVSDAAFEYFVDNAEVLWQVPVAVAFLAAYYAALSLAAASLTDRRLIAGAGLLAVTLVSSAVAAILVGPSGFESPGAVLNLLGLPLYLRDLVFLGQVDVASPLSGVAQGGALAVGVYIVVVGASLATLLHRYRWVDQ
ncbi:ABC transporter permease [soil metagenome]